MDEDEDEDEDVKPTLKRSRGGAAGGARSRGGAENGRPVTKLTGGDKEQRKEARMVRNRSELLSSLFCCGGIPTRNAAGEPPLTSLSAADAAQASRDRKKEHTQLLEQRVTELEAQLESSSSSYPLSFPTSSRSNRSASIDSTCPTPQLVALEDENESLRSQLHFEQLETARLRSRLEGLEDKFARLEQFMSTPLAAAPLPSPSLLLPSDPSPSFEPTFTFAPQEETPGGSVERPATTTDSTTTDSSRLVAREVYLSLQRKLSHSSTPSLSPLSSPTPLTLLPLLRSLPTSTWTSLRSRTSGATGRTASRRMERKRMRPWSSSTLAFTIRP